MTRKSKRLATDIIEIGLQHMTSNLQNEPGGKQKIIEVQEVATLLLRLVKEHRV